MSRVWTSQPSALRLSMASLVMSQGELNTESNRAQNRCEMKGKAGMKASSLTAGH